MRAWQIMLRGVSAGVLGLALAGSSQAELITSSAFLTVGVRHHNLSPVTTSGGALNGLVYAASSVDASGRVMSQGSGFATADSSGGTAFFTGEFTKPGGFGGGYFDPFGMVRYNFAIDAPTTLHMEFTNETAGEMSSGGSYQLTRPDGRLISRSDGASAQINSTTSYGVQLDAGSYVLELASPNNGNAVYAPGSVDNGFTETVIQWGLGSLPGSTPENPILPNVITPDGFTFDIVTNVLVDDGTTNGILFYDPEIAIGYDFASEDAKFASVLIPAALPGGDSVFELVLGTEVFSLLAGELFDFTAIYADGVSAFGIRGIDPAEGLAPGDPNAFVSGLSFVEGGNMARFTMSPVSASTSTVPEPSSIFLFSTGFLALIAQGRKQCHKACLRVR